MLKGRKRELVELLGRVEVAYAMDLAILCGAREFTATRKRLSELVKDGYVFEAWRDGSKIYYLTAEGMNQIETRMKRIYNPKGATTDHALLITKMAAYISIAANVSAKSIIFDKEIQGLQSFSSINKDRGRDKFHSPDLICGSNCYEIELNAKSKSRLVDNFRSNARLFNKQIWVTPNNLPSLNRHLRDLSDEFKSNIVIISVENLESKMKNIDISDNTIGRLIPVRIRDNEAFDILGGIFQ